MSFRHNKQRLLRIFAVWKLCNLVVVLIRIQRTKVPTMGKSREDSIQRKVMINQMVRTMRSRSDTLGRQSLYCVI